MQFSVALSLNFLISMLLVFQFEWIVFSLVLFLSAITILLTSSQHLKTHIKFKVSVFTIVMLIGSIWGAFHLFQLKTSYHVSTSKGSGLLQGEIVSLIEPQQPIQKVRFNTIIDGQKKTLILTFKKRHRQHQPQAGEKWQFYTSYRLNNWNQVKDNRWMIAQRIHGTGIIYPHRFTGRIRASRTGLLFLRQKLLNHFVSIVPARSEGLVIALGMGERGVLSSTERMLFQQTGTAHLLAISGMHIGLVAGLVLLCGLMLWRAISRLKRLQPAFLFAVPLSLMAAFLYAAMAGFSIPTQRALVMVVVAGFMLISQKNIELWSLWAISLLLVLVINPLAPFDTGFWLSFIAVGLIAYTLQSRQVKSKWLSALWVQTAMVISFTPLMMSFFEILSLSAWFSNIMAIPFVQMLLLPLILISTLVSGVSVVAGQWCFDQVDVLVNLLLGMLSTINNSLPVFDVWINPWISLLLFMLCLYALGPKGLPLRGLAAMIGVITVIFEAGIEFPKF